MDNEHLFVVKEESFILELEPLDEDQSIELEVPVVNLKTEHPMCECPVCFAQFPNKDAYSKHMKIHLMQGGKVDPIKAKCDDPVAPHERSAGWVFSLGAGHSRPSRKPSEHDPSAHCARTAGARLPACSATNNEKKVHLTGVADRIDISKQILTSDDDESHNKPPDTNNEPKHKRSRKAASKQNASLKIARETISSGNWNSQNKDTDSKHLNVPTTSNSVVIRTDTVEPATETDNEVHVSKPAQSETDCANNVNNIQCKDSTVNSLHTHLGKHDLKKRCLKTFKRKRHSLRHKGTRTGDKMFICMHCQCRFRCKKKIILHMRSHSGEKPFACNLCDYKCSVRGSLTTHMRTHTGEKPFQCSICDHKFGQKGNLTKHLRTHTGEKPYACFLCDCKYSEKGSLTRHMRTHTGDKPYACSLCDYKYIRKCSLTNHMRTHTGEKPFSCSLCDYKCNESSKLTRHFRIHTGEKRHACSLCDYRCIEKTKLTKHMRIHTGEKPFVCILCDFKCSHNSGLKRHVRTHTGM